MLNLQELKKYISVPVDILLLEDTVSTNAEAKALGMGGSGDTAVFAIRQSGGRGRLGRSFESPAGGIYMSVLTRPNCAPEQCQQLTMAAAVGVRRALERNLGISAGIKWVNDLYYNGRKVCGILAEGGITGRTLGFAVTGIGLNYESPPFTGELSNKAMSLYPKGGPISISRMAASIVNEVYPVLMAFERQDIYEEYRAHSFILGRRVKVLRDGGPEGTAIDILRNGNLLVKLDSGDTQAIYSGEVSVKGIE